MLVGAVREHNVFPLTGYCNLSCVFCSHRHNPPGTEAYSFPPLPEDLLEGLIPYLDPGKKIIIGESATRLREGEPLTHPQFISLIRKIRLRYPDTPIQVTTNGALLDEEVIASMADLKPLELVLSLNSASERGRHLLMGDTRPENAIRSVHLLKKVKISFHGSLVALPHLVGWDDLHNTIEYLDQAGAVTIRYLLPGYTRLSDPLLVTPADAYCEYDSFLKPLRKKFRTPLLAEPPLIENLDALIEGVIKGSPVQKAGLLPDDRIISVAGREVVSRVDTFELLAANANPKVKLMRNGSSFEVMVQKKSSEQSGLAVAYDLDLNQVDRVRSSLLNRAETLMLVSKPALQRWEIAKEIFDLRNLTLRAVPSVYFGGSIECAGLLTASDFQITLDQMADLNRFGKVIIPAIAFDGSARDLSGSSFLAVNASGLPVEMVS